MTSLCDVTGGPCRNNGDLTPIVKGTRGWYPHRYRPSILINGHSFKLGAIQKPLEAGHLSRHKIRLGKRDDLRIPKATHRHHQIHHKLTRIGCAVAIFTNTFKCLVRFLQQAKQNLAIQLSDTSVSFCLTQLNVCFRLNIVQLIFAGNLKGRQVARLNDATWEPEAQFCLFLEIS